MKRYSPDEARVARWLSEQCDVGGGEDPIGFLLASHSLCIDQRNRFQEALRKIAKSTSADDAAALAREALAPD